MIMKITDIRINHMVSPTLDGRPEFSWRIENNENNLLQKAYRIKVSREGKVCFDSGRVESNLQSFIEYGGEELLSRSRYDVQVTAWDNFGNIATGESYFETALLSVSEWKAKWIASSLEHNENKFLTYGIENPVMIYEKSFSLEKTVKKARLYASAYGVYLPLLNGERIDERELAPDFTPYEKILYYQSYDLSESLKKGENKLSFFVGDGWYFCAQTQVVAESYAKKPSLLYQLELEYEDESTEVIFSDGNEKCRKSSIIFSDLFMGEKVDMTLPDDESYDVEIQNLGYGNLKIQALPMIKAVEKFPAKEIYISPRGEVIVDFGQVIAGKCRIAINEPYGTEINFWHTEVVDKDGSYFSTMTARQCDTVISNGKPHIWEPLFTFHGFRYLKVCGMTNPKPEDFTALLLSTHKENAGDFSCSDERFNRLYKNIRYSQKNNMMSIPTDCPSREKAGWTGDILVYAKTAMQNEEMTPFLTSWLSGLAADQRDDGVITLISPYTKIYEFTVKNVVAGFGDSEHTGMAGWSDAIVFVPYDMYRVTGNEGILRKHLSAMKRWCDYIIETAESKRGSEENAELDRYLWNTGFHFGEWLVPGRPSEGFEVCKETACYTAPFFGYKTLTLAAEICELLGDERGAYYGEIAVKMKNAIEQSIIRKNKLPDFLPGAYVLAFAFGLVPTDLKKEYENRLISLCEKADYTIGTGFMATPYVLDVLEQLGRADVAKKILWQNKCPSWLFEVEAGGTAIWENWRSIEDDGTPIKTSFDHYAFGVVDDYIMRRICGIDSIGVGYKHILISPNVDMGFEFVKRTFVCEAGEISVDWNKDSLNVKIPPNTKATVIWKNQTYEIGSGLYAF